MQYIWKRDLAWKYMYNELHMLISDAQYIRHTPDPPPPPPRQQCLPQEIPFKTVKVTLERNWNKHSQFHIKQKAIKWIQIETSTKMYTPF